jgi:D-glycero-D-manno-heptose 1,7-bisphosphate phosphatase
LAHPEIVILDRDGVINYDSADYIKSPAEWQPIPGSLEAIAALCAAGLRVFVVSNQSGIGRGLFTEAAAAAINARMRAAVADAGGAIEGIYVCPHSPDAGCDCRKPLPGLLWRLSSEHGIALAGLPLIGDKWSDILAARAVAARGILVETGQGRQTLREHAHEIAEVFPDLAAAARMLIAECSP